MRKVPLRKCVVTQELLPKKSLTRIVLTPEGTIEVDGTGKKNGRGAYVKLTQEVVEQARKTRALDRALKIKVPDEVYEELLKHAE